MHRLEPAIDLLVVGSEGGPPLPAHIADHLAAGHHHWGIFTVHDAEPAIGALADSIYLIWGASDAEEHIDALNWMP